MAGAALNESPLNCNFVNAGRGVGGSSIIVGKGSDLFYEADQALELVGRIVTEAVQGPGGEIRLKAIDFPAGVITAIEIGGVAPDIDPMTVGTSGRLFCSVPVPDGVRLGRQYLRVELVQRDNGEIFSNELIVDINQPNTVVRVLPQTVLANQRVAISGLGFSEANGMSINEVRFRGFVVEPSRINGGEGAIDVARDGSWSGFLDLPVAGATTVPGPTNFRSGTAAVVPVRWKSLCRRER